MRLQGLGNVSGSYVTHMTHETSSLLPQRLLSHSVGQSETHSVTTCEGGSGSPGRVLRKCGGVSTVTRCSGVALWDCRRLRTGWAGRPLGHPRTQKGTCRESRRRRRRGSPTPEETGGDVGPCQPGDSAQLWVPVQYSALLFLEQRHTLSV